MVFLPMFLLAQTYPQAAFLQSSGGTLDWKFAPLSRRPRALKAISKQNADRVIDPDQFRLDGIPAIMRGPGANLLGRKNIFRAAA